MNTKTTVKQAVTRRSVLLWAGWVGLGTTILVSGSAIAQEQGARRPNIVLFIADDLGYRDIGSFGQDKIKTPNLDALAAGGVKLTTVYSGNSVCAPSRNVLLSGLHPGHAPVRANGKEADYQRGTRKEGQVAIPAGTLQLPLALKSLGYTVGGYGKWGLGALDSSGSPFKQGFDHFGGYICQTVAHNYYPRWLWDDEKQVFLDNPEPSLTPRLKPGADPKSPESYKEFEGNVYAPDVYSRQALEFVKSNHDKPFFLYYPTIVPHVGYQVPAEELKQYEGKIEEAGTFPGSGDYVPALKPRATYAAEITRMDREIGKIISAVKEAGQEENTIFIFLSDNGAPGGNPTNYFNSGGIFRGAKGTIYEGAFRVPGIVAWKGKIAPGGETSRVIGFEDWYPTLLELADAKDRISAGSADGVSFAPTLRGETQPERPFLYREYPTEGQFVRVGDWKLIRVGDKPRRRERPTTRVTDSATEEFVRKLPGVAEPPGGTKPVNGFELYDLKADPSEQKNLAAAHPEIVEKLSKILDSQHVPTSKFPLAALGEGQ